MGALDRFNVQGYCGCQAWVEPSDDGRFVEWSDMQVVLDWLEKSYRDSDKTLEFAIKLRDQLHSFMELFDENDPSSGKLIQEFDDFFKSLTASMFKRNNVFSPDFSGLND